MHRLFTLSLLGALSAAAVLSACADSNKPPETPEGQATATAEAEPPPPPTSDPGPANDSVAMGTGVKEGPKVDKSMMLDNYEMTPSDCDALGRKFGELARGDMMATLSPKLSQKQKDATIASIEKAVAPREEGWRNACMTNLVNKAADHDAIKCALSAKAVKDFDICLNGPGGTPQAPQSGNKPKKK